MKRIYKNFLATGYFLLSIGAGVGFYKEFRRDFYYDKKTGERVVHYDKGFGEAISAVGGFALSSVLIGVGAFYKFATRGLEKLVSD